ncbi:MAG TPA: DUF805 domain-containing protein [Aeromicrobium sp.]|nr:DUF805 domain-containing protein [Aeromicrobium sp.]
MSFQEAIKSVLGNYAKFDGRARRSEYWYWALAVLVAEVIVLAIRAAASGLGQILYFALVLAVLVPSLAVGVRRLHDTGRSGWWLLIALIPIIGAIVLIVFYVQDSQPGANEYGPSPKGDVGAAATPPPPPAPPATPA